MTEMSEKKWFVYLVDHHEGPHSLEEIKEKLTHHIISPQTFAWTEGMAEWRAIQEIPEAKLLFQTEHRDPTPTPALTSVPAPQLESAPSLHQEPEFTIPSEELHPISHDDITGELNLIELEQTKSIGLSAHQESEFKNQTFDEPLEKKQKKSRPYVWLFLFVLITLGGYFCTQTSLSETLSKWMQSDEFLTHKDQFKEKWQPYLLLLSQKFTFLDSLLSPIPPLPGVTPEEREELKRVAMTPLYSSGAKFGIAVSQQDLFSPSFFISTNLPDHTALEVYIIGVPATLLNSLSFQKKENIQITNQLAKTNTIQLPDSKPIPRGEYRIYLIASDTQPARVKSHIETFQTSIVKPPAELPEGKKVLAYKTYFLVGKKDTTYFSRLKEFHDKLKIKSDQEIAEAKQYHATLESQFRSSQTKYYLLQKGHPSERQKKAWTHFDSQWSQLQGQLDLIFSKWTAETLEKEYFHGTLYELIKKTGDQVKILHDLENQFFLGNHDHTNHEKQIADQLSVTQDALAQLLFKIQEAERLPLTADGIPQKSF